MKKLLIFLCVLLLFSCAPLLRKQGVKSYKPLPADKTETRGYNRFQLDFLQLTAICKEGFPLIEEYFPAKERKRMEAKIIARLGKEDASLSTFTVECSKYLGQFQNQHTNIYTAARFSRTFPFIVYNHHQEWYLLNIANQYDSSLIGRKILSLNREPVDSFMKKAAKYVFAENEVSSRKAVIHHHIYNRSDFLKIAGLIPQPDSLLLEVEDQAAFWIKRTEAGKSPKYYPLQAREHPITSRKGRSFDYQLLPDSNAAYFQLNLLNDKDEMLEMVSTYVKGWMQPLARTYLRWQFKKRSPSKAVRRWFDPQRPSLKKYLAQMMQELDSLNIQNLIIDLRHNPGGNMLLGKQLIYHLSQEDTLEDFRHFFYPSEISRLFQPHTFKRFRENYLQEHQQEPAMRNLYPLSTETKSPESFFERLHDPSSGYYIAPDRKVFKGKVYVLANWTSGSAAALLTALLQDNKLATIIGSSVANNPSGPTTYTPYALPHTGARGSIASAYLIRPDSSRGKILQPHFWVEPSMQEYLAGKDPAWEKAMELISASKAPGH